MKKKWTVKRILKTIWITAGLFFIVLQFYSFQAKGVDNELLKSSNTTKVEQSSGFYLFTPVQPFKDVFIFYPGAMVDPKAYVPLCRKIADNGIQVYLVKMPWRLASKG